MRVAFRLPAILALLVLPAEHAAAGAGLPVSADYSRTPVLMVHGWFIIDDAGTATWANFRKRLVEDGWPDEYIATPSFRDVTGCDPEHAGEIAAWVDDLLARTGADHVDIVAHSAGALNTLYYLRFLCGVHKVRNFVSLAGAFHGTVVACVDITQTCGAVEMCIGSKPGAWTENPALAAVLAGDETPGDVLYTSIWSEYDEVIVPPSGSILAGARNIEVETDWVEHGGIFLCDECYALVRQALLEGTGLNEDGPGYEHFPACAPTVLEPMPESPSDAGEDGWQEAADAAVEDGSGPGPDSALDEPEEPPYGAGEEDRGGTLDVAVAPRPDTRSDTVLPSVGGCVAGAPAGGAWGVVLLLPAIRRRRTS